MSADRDTCGDAGGIYVDGSVDTNSLSYSSDGLLNFNYTDSNGNPASGTFDPDSGLLTDAYGNVLFDTNNYASDVNQASTDLANLSRNTYGESEAGLKMDLILTAPATVTTAVITGGDALEAANEIAAANPDVIIESQNFLQGYMRIGSNYTPAGIVGSALTIVYKLFK